jgi:hypothetical protein
MYLPDANQAIGFLVSQTAHIESQVVETVYPEIQYQNLIPIDTSADEWATSVTYYSMNKTGQAGWFHHYAKDIHVADSERAKHEVGIEMADIGYRWTLQEIGVAMKAGYQLSADRASAAKLAYEQFVDNLALYGDSSKNFYGLTNYPGITSVDVEADGGTGGDEPSWATKDADQILRDVNAALVGQYVDTLQVEIADTILMPVRSLALIATKRVGDTNMTVLQFLQMNNVYTFQTGRPLTIRAVRGLETAGDGGVGRMVVYRRAPDVLKMHIPMTHRFMPPWQTGPLVWDIPGIFRVAGLEIRKPGAFRYVDGVLDAEYQ